MAYGVSSGHVADDVTRPWKVKLVIPIRLERNISKTAGDRDSVPKDHQYEIAYGVSNGHVTDDVTWPPKVLWGSTLGYPSDSLAWDPDQVTGTGYATYAERQHRSTLSRTLALTVAVQKYMCVHDSLTAKEKTAQNTTSSHFVSSSATAHRLPGNRTHLCGCDSTAVIT